MAATLNQLQAALEKHLPTLQGLYGWEGAQQNAYTYFQTASLPTQRSEAYKHTPISSLLAEKFDLSQPPAYQPTNNAVILEPYIQAVMQQEVPCYPLILINGAMANTRPGVLQTPPATYQAYSFQEAYTYHKDLLDRHFQDYSLVNRDIFAVLNTALFSNAVFIYIPDNTILDKPLWIYQLTDSTVQSGMGYPRILAWVGQNSQISLVNSWHTLGNYEAFTNAVTEIVIGGGAHVDYYNLQLALGKTCHVNTTHSYQAAHSTIKTYTITCDGLLVRNNLHLQLQASHTQAKLYGLYCLAGTQHVDNQTTVDHEQPDTTSHEIYKGMLAEKSTGVFNGKIYVHPKAQHTLAFQRNNNILLSQGAIIYTKPQLEIWADDVKCSHGATVGQLEEEQLFYLRTRGIPEKEAQKMLLHAFSDEVMNTIPSPLLKEYIKEKLSTHLNQLI